MQYTTLGRTDLRVSIMGIGGGGPSRLGQKANKPEVESIAIIKQALDAGVNFIDTAEGYGTEDIVGQAIRGISRDDVVISTKKSIREGMTPQDMRDSLEASLKRLGTDYIDIYHLHGVKPDQYDALQPDIVPTLLRFKEEGKIRYTGITEHFNTDPLHGVLAKALDTDLYDVIMVGFNLLNQTARANILPTSIRQNVGVLVMFAVRLALSRPDRLREVISDLVQAGELDSSEIDLADPLDFLVTEGGASSITDAAYRFCRDEPGTHVVLVGTGNPAHLQENIESLDKPPLPESVTERLKTIFRHVDSVTGQ